MPLEVQNEVKLIEVQPINCGFCYLELDSLSIQQREAHYDRHFSNDNGTIGKDNEEMAPIDVESIESLHKPLKGKKDAHGSNKNPESSKKKFQLVKETDVFWFPEQETPPPASFTPGLIPLLRKALLKGHDRGNVRRAVLCYDKAVHVHREPWDATWGCGYRNFMMACSVLMSQSRQPLYFPLLDCPLSPSIRNLQAWIEDAWKEGFDPEGKKDLQKLIGTRKWIGTADLWVAFVFRRIPALLVDFDLRNQAQGSQLLINWIVDYFSPPKQENTSNAFESLTTSPIISTKKMPIILQHDGHSRTVVGYEIDRNGVVNLLVFDPAYRPNPEVRNLALAEFAKARATQAGRPLSAYRLGLHFNLNSGLSLGDRSPDAWYPRASMSTLKRKRSMNVSSQGENSPELGEGSRLKIHASSSKVLLPLKNGLYRGGPSREEREPDLYSTLKKFRLEPKNLSKKKQYQILHFPMDAPLTDYEQTQRKEVRSTKMS